MKKLLTILLVLLVSLTNAQEFMGVKVEGTKTQAIQKFLAKGFKITNQEDTWVKMLGNFNRKKTELFLLFTPQTKKFWKLAVYLPETSSWSELKSDYLYYQKILTEKYGEPTESYSTFLSPYEEGDGYESSAVTLEKCVYSSFWMDNGIIIEISKYKQIHISYENLILSQIQDKEKTNIDRTNL